MYLQDLFKSAQTHYRASVIYLFFTYSNSFMKQKENKAIMSNNVCSQTL